MDAKAIFGWNLRKYRVELALSQEALALEAQIDRAYLGRVERGSENVTLNTVETLRAILGVKIDDLFRTPEPNELKPETLRAGRKPLLKK